MSESDWDPLVNDGTAESPREPALDDDTHLETAIDFLKATAVEPEPPKNTLARVTDLEEPSSDSGANSEAALDTKSGGNVQRQHSRCRIPGVVYAIMSAFFLSLCSVLVKVLGEFEPAELAMIRFIGILLPSLVISIHAGHNFFPAGRRRLLLLRACLGTTALICKFYAVRQMPLADASVILLSAPVFVAVFARIFLGESCGWLHVITIFLTLGGVVLITRPPALFGGAPIPKAVIAGSILAFTSTLFSANVYVAMRMLRGVAPTVIMANFSAVAAPVGLVVCSVVGQFRTPQTVRDGMLLFVLAVSSFLGQLCLTRAVQTEEAGLVAIVRTITEVLLAMGWQMALFSNIPGLLSLGGMSMVTTSVILVGLKKWVAAKPEGSPLKSSLGCLV